MYYVFQLKTLPDFSGHLHYLKYYFLIAETNVFTSVRALFTVGAVLPDKGITKESQKKHTLKFQQPKGRLLWNTSKGF